jgi:hypothetical protein
MAKGFKTGGRKPGTPNRMTNTLKASIEEAFGRVGGVEWLVKQAGENPQAFMTLLGRVLPREMNVDMSEGTVVLVRDYTGRKDGGHGAA